MDAASAGLFQRMAADTPVVLTCAENATASEGNGTEITVVVYYVLD